MHPQPADDDDVVDATVVPIRAELEVVEPDEDTEKAVEQYRPKSALALRAESTAARPIVAPPEYWAAAAKWWWRVFWRDLSWFVTHPWVAFRELRPILRGIQVTWLAWKDWETEADLGDSIRAMPKDSASRATEERRRAELRSGHRRLSFVSALLVLVAVGVTYLFWPIYLLAAGIAAVVVFDIVGRRHPDVDAPPPPVRRTLLEEGAPLRAVGDSVVRRLNEDGIRADLASAVTAHPGGEYRVLITHEDEIGAKHLRSLERHMAGRPTAFRLIGTEDAGTSELRMPTRDHLARVPQRRWASTGLKSIADPAELWLRADGDTSAPIIAGVHIDLVGTTGAGKTEALQEFISFFGECSDVYPVFGDLTRGPIGPLNKRVLRKQAYSVEELEVLLDWALDQVEERHMILHRLAESDDDDAPVEWDLRWGPQIELILDEYSFIAEFDGQGGRPDLHGTVEKIMRVGRKVKVCVIRASQRSGNKDMGSTVAQALVGLKILMACTERDTTTMLSTVHRDRGWTPHMFRPAVPGDARDAGKCFVSGPSHRDPEIHRFHAPLEPSEIKRRDRQRAMDGLPNLDGTPPGEESAILLSPTQRAVEEIFAEHDAPWLPTKVIQAGLVTREITVSNAQLGDELGNVGSREPWEGKSQVRGYSLADVHRAWGAAE
jgi:hypothetical protein